MEERPSFKVPGNLKHTWGDGFESFRAAVEYAMESSNMQLDFPWSIALRDPDDDDGLGDGRAGYISFRVGWGYALSLSPLPPVKGRHGEIVLAKGLPSEWAFEAMGEELNHLRFFTPNLILNEAYGRLGFRAFSKCKESQLELDIEGGVEPLYIGEGSDLAHEIGYELCDRLIEETGSNIAVVDDLLRYHTLEEIAGISGVTEQKLNYGLSELMSEFQSVSIKELFGHTLFHHRFINKGKPYTLLPRSVRRYHTNCNFREWRNQRV